MNATIKRLNYNDLLFFDIETVGGEKDFDENHPYFDAWAWKQRDKDTSEIPDTAEVIKAYKDKAALYPEWGKIVCISVGFIHNKELNVKSFVGEESEILTEFVNLVKNTNRTLVGHNVIGFDLPYVRKRWFINGLGEYLSGKQGNEVNAKPWDLEEIVIDTMRYWKGASFINSSLEELAMCFGIPSPKEDIRGNQVTKVYYEEGVGRIREYCERDVATVANILRVWKGDEILEPTIKTEAVVKELTAKEKLLEAGVLTDELLEEIKSKGKISKAEKERLRKILVAAITEAKSRKAIKEEKELEVEQFLENL